MRQTMTHIALTLFVVVFIIQSGCVKEMTNQPLANQPPKTYFWIFPDSTIASGISKQQLHWWGEDTDGYVVGYLIAFASGISTVPSPDTLTYGYTAVTDSTMQFPLRQASATILMVVRAIDNTFKVQLPRGATVRMLPQPYWDVNQSGGFDAGDVALPGLAGAIDPESARQKFPLKNSPPTISLVKDPNDETQNLIPPETTFTVISFAWQGADLDGLETIASYRIALNSTAPGRWLTMAPNVTQVTLMVPRARSDAAGAEVTADVYSGAYPSIRYLGQVQGLKLNASNVFYAQAQDVAAEFSPVLAHGATGRTWYVKKPQSRLLVISDYQKGDSLSVQRFYRARFSEFAGGALANYDMIDIRTGSPAIGKPGVLVPSITFLNPMFVYTLKLYDYVFWYTDQFPSLTVAQYSLFYYSSSGGKVLYATEFATTNDPGGALRDFAPIDSVSSVILPNATGAPGIGATSIRKNYLVNPQAAGYPLLNVDSVTVSDPITIRNLHSVFIRPVYRRADASEIYRLQADPRISSSPGSAYLGQPLVGVVRNDKHFVFMGFPLHLLNGRAGGGEGLAPFLNKVFVGEFGL